MVRLKNITRNEKIISCDYYPESSDQKGFIKVNLDTKEIIFHTESSFDKGFRPITYAKYAKMRLLDIADNKPLPKETVAMWY